MKTILLDFNVTETPEQVQAYLALTMEFPEHYGNNLDALYDMLTEEREDRCVGFFPGRPDRPVSPYLEKVKRVFATQPERIPILGVIFSELEDNYEEE